MLIEIENTPNPATLKFLPGRAVMGDKSPLNFTTREGNHSAPLAEALFALPDVKTVFLGHDFISVTKTDASEWSELRPVVLASLTSFIQSGQPFYTHSDSAEGSSSDSISDRTVSPEDEKIIAQIKELLNERVRPAVAGDGGDIIFKGYKGGIVFLTMQGACAGCPSSKATLRHGVESMLRHYIPEVTAVEQVEE